MSDNVLYIIGNGFDIHHGIKSRYPHFKEYLEVNDLELLGKLNEYFNQDSLWSDFEETLAYLDTDNIVDHASNYLASYSDENWRDSYNHDYQYEVEKAIDVVTVDLKNKFTEWILQLAIPNAVNDSKLTLSRSGLFLNFNYTNTLEKAYKIPPSNILYIYNKAIDKSSTLILGHSRDPHTIESLNDSLNVEDQDVRITEANEILDSYFRNTYKSTQTIINENSTFFETLKDTSEIYVLGHSLSSVDMGYFFEIVKNIDKDNVRWNVSFYNKKELAHHQKVLAELMVDKKLVRFDTLKNMFSQQLLLFPPAY